MTQPKGTPVVIRPELLRFTEAMERVLRENDYKGDTSAGFPPEHMLDRMWDEIRELDRITHVLPETLSARQQYERMRKESVDVANFCMLFWLGCGTGEPDEGNDEADAPAPDGARPPESGGGR